MITCNKSQTRREVDRQRINFAVKFNLRHKGATQMGSHQTIDAQETAEQRGRGGTAELTHHRERENVSLLPRSPPKKENPRALNKNARWNRNHEMRHQHAHGNNSKKTHKQATKSNNQ